MRLWSLEVSPRRLNEPIEVLKAVVERLEHGVDRLECITTTATE
jgi:hypothetical protein